MLFERVTNSTLANTIANYREDGSVSAPLVTIADAATHSGFLIFRHFITSALKNKEIGNVIVLCLEHSSEFWEQQLDLFTSISSHQTLKSKLSFVSAPSTISSSIAGFPSLSLRLRSFRCFDLTNALAPTIVQASASGKPSFLCIDSFSHLLLHNEVGAVVSWIEEIRTSGMIHGISSILHTDALPTISSGPIFPSTPQSSAVTSPSPSSSASCVDILSYTPPSGVFILNTILSITSTYIQTLLPINDVGTEDQNVSSVSKTKKAQGATKGTGAKHMAPVVACRVYHKRSTGKITNGAENLRPPVSTTYGTAGKAGLVPGPGPLKGSAYIHPSLSREQQGLGSAPASRDENISAIKKLTAGLSFNLELSEKQRVARGKVELPYMHQGQQPGELSEDEELGDDGNNSQEQGQASRSGRMSTSSDDTRGNFDTGILSSGSLIASSLAAHMTGGGTTVTSDNGSGFLDNIDYDEYEVEDDFGDDEEI